MATVLLAVVPQPAASAQVTDDATAAPRLPCPTPTPSPSPSPSPDVTLSPTPSPTESPIPDDRDCDDEDDKDKDKKDRKKRNRHRKDRDSLDRARDAIKRNKAGKGGNDRKGRRSDSKKRAKKNDDKRKKNKKGSKKSAAYRGKYNGTGDFDTDKLQLIATQLKARGVPEKKIVEAVYPPFIIGGPAAWTDTWGAPRYGPGPIVRTHEGQDVFCKYGDPVLAVETGTIEFDEGGLGGIVARLHRKNGSYWYYAHLSDVNDKEFENGDAVERGDVIGYCGNTGNAISTPPHVHFGWYDRSGENARDPMRHLVGWLNTAERRAASAYERITGESIGDLADTISIRRFGDDFAPDISELKVSSGSLVAASSSSATGALGLAETALRQALSEDPDSLDSGLEVDHDALSGEGAGDSHSELSGLLGPSGN
jgi:murein DD-endopeptidase MepM/ murein hydrolase activator NlpD